MSTFLITILMCFKIVTISGDTAWGLWCMCAFADIVWMFVIGTFGAYMERVN